MTEDHRGPTGDLLELHARVAERVCGWHTIQYEEWPGSLVPMLWHESLGRPRGRDFGRLADGRWVSWNVPHYSTNRDACAEAEAEIARRGLQGKYLEALAAELKQPNPHVTNTAGTLHLYEWHLEDVWALFTAPPDVRVRAMLRVLEDQ